MEKLSVISLFAAIFYVGQYVGRWFNLDVVPRMDAWGVWYHYPFTCEKCFTTWLLCGSYIAAAYMLSNPWFGAIGCIASIGNGIGMWLTEMERRTDKWK